MTPYRSKPKRVWPGVLDEVPEEFADCLREPAFAVEDTTFCIWRHHGDRGWHVGPVEFPHGPGHPDGSESLLSALDGRPETYQVWAAEYYDLEVSLAAVEHVYQHRPLTREVVARLNPELSLTELADDRDEIGYPRSSGTSGRRGLRPDL